MRRLQPVEGHSPAVMSDAVEKINRLQEAIETVIKGKPEAVRLSIVTLIAGAIYLLKTYLESARQLLRRRWLGLSTVAFNASNSLPTFCLPT
jgi:hypothetical protein